MKKIIYDLGACRGENLNYYLSKSDMVIAVEANPENYKYIYDKFLNEIKNEKLILLNCIVGIDPNISNASFYVHKKNYLVGQFPEPKIISDFKKIRVSHIDIFELIKKYGTAHYIKIDLEEYDHIVLNRIITSNIEFDYISAEIKKINDFYLFSKFKEDCSFKLVNGHNVHIVYEKFVENSAGPFANDIKGSWISYKNFSEFLEFKLKQNGWLDVHCSLIDQKENTFLDQKYFLFDRLLNIKIKFKKKLFRWKKKYIK